LPRALARGKQSPKKLWGFSLTLGWNPLGSTWGFFSTTWRSWQ